MNTPDNFIIVDDDPISNMICKTVIKKAIPKAMITSFTEPEKALDYLMNELSGNRVTLLLDINMPTMTGWDFLDSFVHLNDAIKKNISVCILSSSVDSRDKERAASNKLIKGFLSKPLTAEMIVSLMARQLSA
ncbi:response regulator [Taibaiella soli]|uniref:Response regulator n=1 Tax=Taibaiella soli TaxID=1649169 RepID=A0A2W2AUZ2_9BACT|nr:response regulator [Taibaiella soli]PZF71774.1 response regulator [Taibaiella soli]